MKRKLSLRLEDLRVSSFETAGEGGGGRGTVHGQGQTARCQLSGDTHCRSDVCDTGFDQCYSLGGTCGAAPYRREGVNDFGPLCA